MPLPQGVIFDLDGTLALLGERSPYNASRAEDDELSQAVFFAYEAIRRGKPETAIILLSGREDRWRPQTERWLTRHGIRDTVVLFRRSGVLNQLWDTIAGRLIKLPVGDKVSPSCLEEDQNHQATHYSRYVRLSSHAASSIHSRLSTTFHDAVPLYDTKNKPATTALERDTSLLMWGTFLLYGLSLHGQTPRVVSEYCSCQPWYH